MLFVVPFLLSLIGYQVNASSNDVAEEAAQKKDVTLCATILSYGLLRPQTGELRSHCVKTYASLAKDPSACELLMPSSYGLSCVGGAMEFQRTCALGRDRSVTGNDIGKASLQECISGPESIRNNECCVVAKARFLTTFNDCSLITKSQKILDQCHYSLAFKNGDSSTCESIQDKNLKSACEVESTALKQDPSICQGCTQPLESIEDLE